MPTEVKTPEVLEKDDERVAALAKNSLDKMLVPFSDSLPYSPERYQQEITMLFSMECLLRYERGRRLIVMWEREKISCPNFGQFMEKFFPKIRRQRAYEAMAYARKTENCPQFRGLAESKGGWAKALLLMDMSTQEDLEEFEKTGEILGITWDDLESKTLKQLQAKLRGIEAAHQKELSLAKAANSTLQGQVEELEAALADPDKESALKLIAGAGKHLDNALKLLNKLPRELLAQDAFLRQAAYAVLSQVKGDAEFLEMEIGALAGDPGEMVRGYMGRLQAEAAGADS